MTKKPQDELYALYQSANTTLDCVETATGIKKLKLKRYMSGYSVTLSIDEINSIRSFLIECIRKSTINLADQDSDLMAFLCKCKLTSVEIQRCVALSLPVSALLAAVRGEVMNFDVAAAIIRRRLNETTGGQG